MCRKRTLVVAGGKPGLGPKPVVLPSERCDCETVSFSMQLPSYNRGVNVYSIAGKRILARILTSRSYHTSGTLWLREHFNNVTLPHSPHHCMSCSCVQCQMCLRTGVFGELWGAPSRLRRRPALRLKAPQRKQHKQGARLRFMPFRSQLNLLVADLPGEARGYLPGSRYTFSTVNFPASASTA